MAKKPDNPEEAYLLEALKDIFGDDAIKPAQTMGDVQTPGYQWEHKYRNTEGFTVRRDHWNKIKGRAALRGAHAVLVIRNKHRERIAVVDLDMLLSHIKYYKHRRQDE